jgi:hypothetical protein
MSRPTEFQPFDLFFMNADGSEPKNVTMTLPGNEDNPLWNGGR